jgi:hypothetical protein
MTATLAPIRKTAFHATGRTGRQECWEAETTDSQWSFVRTEDTSTPWLVYRHGNHAPQHWCGTLRACRTWVATR